MILNYVTSRDFLAINFCRNYVIFLLNNKQVCLCADLFVVLLAFS